MARFSSYAENGCRVRSVGDLTSAHVAGFVLAQSIVRNRSAPPSVATMHLRRSAVRLYFRIARDLKFLNGDPTLDLQLPSRSSLPVRPLTDDEVQLCRSCSFRSISDTVHPAAWALAETGARTSEIPCIQLHDLDPKLGRVWLHGSNKTRSRWVPLTPWGLKQVCRRASVVRQQGRQTLVYRGSGTVHSAQAAACIAVSETLERAGLHSETDVRPRSLVAWAGLRVFNRNRCIDEVARLLGLRTLDGAARMIGWDWQILDAPGIDG